MYLFGLFVVSSHGFYGYACAPTVPGPCTQPPLAVPFVPLTPGNRVALGTWAFGLLVLANQDRRSLHIPTRAVWGLGAVTVLLMAAAGARTGDWSYLSRGALCAVLVLTCGTVWLLATLLRCSRSVRATGTGGTNALGMGDVRMGTVTALGAGAVDPVRCLTALCISLLAAGLISCVDGRRADGPSVVALGPFLAAAGIATVAFNAF